MGLFQDVIFVEDECFRVKNTVYEAKDIEKFLKKAKKKRKIIIYNESIYPAESNEI